MPHLRTQLFLLASLVACTSAFAAGDATRGARAFQQCMACHSVQPGRHLTGPSLARAWGSRAGTAPGFLRYSDALQHSGLTWDAATLDRWLAKPEALVPGNAMSFPGVPDAGMRADLIAYLQSVAEGRAPARAATGGMMAGAEPLDLRTAQADSKVTAMRRCRDTYIVTTADGQVHKVWEYNLRLKTDSSDRGPQPGTPVVVGSGMRGDRVSIVFSSAAEIGRMVRESCD